MKASATAAATPAKDDWNNEATEKTEAKADAKAEPEGVSDDGVPTGDGWEDTGAPPLDGWWAAQKGSVIEGRVVGRMRIQQNDDGRQVSRHVILVQSSKPTLCSDPESKEEGATRTLEAGSIIAVGLKHRLKELLFCVKFRNLVWIRSEGKTKIKGNKTVANFTVKTKGKKAKPDPISVNLDAIDGLTQDEFSAPGDDGDIPF